MPLSRVLTDREALGARCLPTQNKPVQPPGHLWALPRNCFGGCQGWGAETGVWTSLVSGANAALGAWCLEFPYRYSGAPWSILAGPAWMSSSPRFAGTRLRSARGSCRRGDAA